MSNLDPSRRVNAGDVYVAQQGQQQGLQNQPPMQTRADTGALPKETEQRISEQAEFLSDQSSGMTQAQSEFGAGRNAAKQDERGK